MLHVLKPCQHEKAELCFFPGDCRLATGCTFFSGLFILLHLKKNLQENAFWWVRTVRMTEQENHSSSSKVLISSLHRGGF